LAAQLDNCGSRKDTVKTQSEKSIETTKARCVQMLEFRKKQEEQKIENEIKAKENQAKAEVLLTEFVPLVTAAEAALESLKEAAAVFSKEGGLNTAAELTSATKKLTTAAEASKEKAKVCTEFLGKNASAMKTPAKIAPKKDDKAAEEAKDEAAEIPTLAVLQRRANTCTGVTNTTVNGAESLKALATKKIAAKDVMDKRQAAFKKSDTDKDGALNKKEIIKFAKADGNFTLSEGAADKILKYFVAKGGKGVNSDDVHRLRVAVGVEKEKVRDLERRKKRLAREEELAKLKTALESVVAGVAKKLVAANEKVSETEKEAGKKHDEGTKGPVYLQHVTDVENLIKASKDAIESGRTAIKGLDADKVDSDLKSFLEGEAKKLEVKATQFENRTAKVETGLKKLRTDAKKKAGLELDKLRADSVTIMRHHRSVKKLTSDAMFGEIDAIKDGKVGETEFTAFFNKCVKPEGEKAPTVAAEDLPRLFAHLDEESEGFLTKESFTRIIRSYMKVLKDTVMTSAFSIKDKDSKTVVKLVKGDVVEVLKTAEKEDSVGVMRIQAKAMSDGTEGFITVVGNADTTFLADCTGCFRVIKETILTDSFDLSEKKEVTRSLHQTTKKLAVGDIVDVREWPKKEETSGLTRMQCRAKSDGRVGWATTLGNAGAVFMQVI